MLKKVIALKNHTGFMRYFKNTSWLSFQSILRMAVSLFVGVWVARYLGPEQFGLFAYVQSFVGLFAIVATLGLDGIVVRELVKGVVSCREILATAFILKLLGAAIVLLFLFVAIHFTSNDSYTNKLIFIVAGSAVFQSFNVIDFYFQSIVLSKYVVFSNLIALSLSTILKIFLVLVEAPLEAFVYVVLFDSFVVACGLIYFIYVKFLSSIKMSLYYFLSEYCFWNRELAKNLLRDSWPLILVGAASAMNMRLDQVFLDNMLGHEVVGNYAAAVRLAEVWLILPVVIGSSIYPALISAKQVGEPLYKHRVCSTVKYMALFAIPVALIVTFLANDITGFLYGKAYSESGTYLALYIWTGVPYLIFFAVSQMMLIENITKISFYVALVSVVLNLSFNLLLIPVYGGLGAIFATLIATYTAVFVSVVIINYKTAVFWTMAKKREIC